MHNPHFHEDIEYVLITPENFIMSLPRQSSVSPLRDKHCSDFFFTLTCVLVLELCMNEITYRILFCLKLFHSM